MHRHRNIVAVRKKTKKSIEIKLSILRTGNPNGLDNNVPAAIAKVFCVGIYREVIRDSPQSRSEIYKLHNFE